MRDSRASHDEFRIPQQKAQTLYLDPGFYDTGNEPAIHIYGTNHKFSASRKKFVLSIPIYVNNEKCMVYDNHFVYIWLPDLIYHFLC